MRSIKSCWEYLRTASEDHVIVSLGAGAYDILPIGPDSRGNGYLESSPARVVAPMKVNGRTSMVWVRADGPWPMMMSSL